MGVTDTGIQPSAQSLPVPPTALIIGVATVCMIFWDGIAFARRT